MVVVFLIIGILLLIAGLIGIGTCRYNEETVWSGIMLFASLLIACNIIAMFFLINNCKQLDILDRKIEMFQEENKNIESSIDVLVKQYMNHEKDTLTDFKSESSITLVNLYPELKSNELVQQQLNIYVENNNKIKSLKEKKLDYLISKWWLYFGKVK